MARPDPIAALRAGGIVTAVNDHPVSGGVELWMAAELAEASVFARMVRYSSGFVTVAMPASRCAALGLPAMTGIQASFTETHPVQAVTCDAADGISTGISAADRSLTARLLADPESTPNHFLRPGHVVPLRIRSDVTRPTAPAALALRMCSVAGLQPAMIRCEVVTESGALARATDGLALAELLETPVVKLTELSRSTPFAQIA